MSGQRDQILAALASKLTATRTVLAGSDTAAQLALHHQTVATHEHGGENWVQFSHAPDNLSAVTVWFGAGIAGMSATATLGQLADAVADALNVDEAPAARHPIGFTAPPRVPLGTP